ncbi:hypothetical protein J7M23_07885 [Candidatus Sumerlaeota bacterium]|nr:hypothetical protein [Candidatus Sumerlaeota bacterium]
MIVNNLSVPPKKTDLPEILSGDEFLLKFFTEMQNWFVRRSDNFWNNMSAKKALTR